MEYESISITTWYLDIYGMWSVYTFMLSVSSLISLSPIENNVVMFFILYSVFSTSARVKTEMDFYNILEDDEWKSQELLQMTAFCYYVLNLCILWTGLGISMS